MAASLFLALPSMDPHPASAHIAHRDATSLLAELDAGTCTAVDVVTDLLDRIAAIDDPASPIALRSVVAIAPDALAVAQERDRERAAGRLRGPLHGVPVLVKDNIEVRGLPAAAGSLALVDAPATSDAPIVARLRDAGAIVLGATNCSEWANIRSAHSTSGWSALGGLTANPWALDRSAGGSSSGSGAALAAGLAPLAIGTETDGSIVCPAALNGVVGLKPTVGLLPQTGIVPISHSQDTAGPMARTVADVRLLFEVLGGAPLPAVDVRALRVAAVPQWYTGQPATDRCFDAVVARLDGVFGSIGTRPVPAMTPELEADELTVLLTELHDDLARYLADRRPTARVRTLADVVAFNATHAAEELAHFGQDLFEQAVARGGVDDDARSAQQRVRAWARDECLDPALQEFDLLIAPTYAPAWKHDFLLGHPNAGGAVTSPAAVAGYPLLSLPMGLVAGLPVGLTIVGRPHGEATMLAAAAAIERALGLAGMLRPRFAPPGRG